ncbi:MAG TPA: right-handed parallel beta-helix repeat-containing protein, partial [Pyrinomonadaceae bacterium]|nr:right-handed parallel beta-helix repeat-containing protein [Pyrinomonadaceae bacterium]
CTLLVFGTSLASAQSSRTWVSGVGDDINPCSRTAPCKTFSGAISKTATNGEINAIDPGGFGTLTITKSLTVDGTGTMAGILASGAAAGITVNITTAASTDPLRIVRLRNLSLNGTGVVGGAGTRSATRGINVSSANASPVKVIIEDVVIDNFINEGILFAGNGGDLVIDRSSIRNNGTAGIRADSFGANTVFVTVRNSYSGLNAQEGIRIEDNVKGTATNSNFSNNTLNGVAMVATTTASTLNIDLSQVSNNRQFGVVTAGALGTIRLTGNEITDNVTNGISISSGSVCTNQKNHITTPTMAANCTFLDQ